METRAITYHHQSVLYRVAGTGHPVMLLHGFGEDGDIWNNQLSGLQHDFRVYIPDLPGTGLSAHALEAEKEWTMEKFAGVVREIAIHEHLNTFTLLGRGNSCCHVQR